MMGVPAYGVLGFRVWGLGFRVACDDMSGDMALVKGVHGSGFLLLAKGWPNCNH